MFIAYDQTGLYSQNIGADPNVILRILLFFSGLLYIIINLIYNAKLKIRVLKRLKVPIIFYSLFLILIILGKKISIQESVYRLFEWFVYILILYFFLLYRKNTFNVHTYKNILDKLSYIFILLILFCTIFYSDLIYNGRLGGTVIGPNTFGVISSLLLYHNFLKKKYFFSIIFFAFVILSKSRGALFCTSITLIYLIYYSTGIKKYIMIFLLLPLVFILSNSIINFILRDQTIENIFTFSERYYVFLSSIEIIKTNYLFGTGFVTGTTIISNYMSELGVDHWTNVHSHNEFLQAFSTGGIILLSLSLFIFYYIFKKSLFEKEIEYKKLMIINFFHIFYFSISMTTISYVLNPVGCLIWLTFILENNQKNDN